jgi:hypothetical protein
MLITCTLRLALIDFLKISVADPDWIHIQLSPDSIRSLDPDPGGQNEVLNLDFLS